MSNAVAATPYWPGISILEWYTFRVDEESGNDTTYKKIRFNRDCKMVESTS
jgi:hypothetical protein